jgi:hypothetical protein
MPPVFSRRKIMWDTRWNKIQMMPSMASLECSLCYEAIPMGEMRYWPEFRDWHGKDYRAWARALKERHRDIFVICKTCRNRYGKGVKPMDWLRAMRKEERGLISLEDAIRLVESLTTPDKAPPTL